MSRGTLSAAEMASKHLLPACKRVSQKLSLWQMRLSGALWKQGRNVALEA